jgi:Holliday junction resolvasome RuvABC ATP-dependent DNA helicase subunit
MEEYSENELIDVTSYHSRLLSQKYQTSELDLSIKKEIAVRSRGVPRNIVRMLKSVYDEQIVSKTISLNDAIKVIEDMGIFRYGLSRLNLKIMRLLEQNGPLSLSALCGATGESETTIRKEEAFMIRSGWLSITTRRTLSEKGREVLISLPR